MSTETEPRSAESVLSYLDEFLTARVEASNMETRIANWPWSIPHRSRMEAYSKALAEVRWLRKRLKES